MLFGESLKTLLENYKFRNGRSVVVKDFTLENFEELDVLVSDYDSTKFNEFLSNTTMQKKQDSAKDYLNTLIQLYFIFAF